MTETELKTGRRQTRVGVIKLESNKSLFSEGDPGKELYILESGRLRVTQGEGSEEVELSQLEPGAIVGEMSLFDGQPRSANVIALEPSIIKVIPQTAFNKMMNLLPVWLKAIINIVVARIREANHRLEANTIVNPTFSLIEYFHLHPELFQYSYFELLDDYSLLSRSTQEGFSKSISKLETNQLIELETNSKGEKFVVIKDPDGIQILSLMYKDYRNKRIIPAKELTHDSITCLEVISELVRGGLPISSNKETFLSKLSNQNSRLSERSLAQLLKFQIIDIDQETILINKPKLEALELEQQYLPLLKVLLS